MSQANIDLLNEYCDEYALTTEQRASLLAIIGDETKWEVVVEDPKWYRDINDLMAKFPTAFKGDREIAAKYVNLNSPSDFFNFIYAPYNGGDNLGNVALTDGYKYRSRGFFKNFTGKANYEWAQKCIFSDPMFKGQFDLVDKPDWMIQPDIAARVAVVWFKVRMPMCVEPTAHPHFFYAAVDYISSDLSSVSRTNKLSLYEHFYGVKTPESYGYEESVIANPLGFNNVLNDESYGLGQVEQLGFKCKKPRRKKHRSEISKLASGDSANTIVTLKDSKRKIGIPTAFGGQAWHEPEPPFSPQYPHNRVTETESGHVQEFDDTPGAERIHTYHRSGTYEEINANGSKVTRIVGDNYTIIDNNGRIFICGDAAITTAGKISILCMNNADIEVQGSAETRVSGNMKLNVGGDMSVAVGGKFAVWSEGNMYLQSKKSSHIRTEGNTHISSEGAFNVKSKKNLYLSSTEKNVYMMAEDGNIAVGAKKNVHVKSEEKKVLLGAPELHFGAEKKAFLSSADEVNITSKLIRVGKSGDDQVKINAETFDNATPAASSTAGTKALLHGMLTIRKAIPVVRHTPLLETPAMHQHELYQFENPTEADNPVSEAIIQKKKTMYGEQSFIQTDSVPAPKPSGKSGEPSFIQTEILSKSNFDDPRYKLSTNITLEMLLVGGHIIKPQVGLTTQQIMANLSALAQNVIEPLITKQPDGSYLLPGGMDGRAKGRWWIASAFRMVEKNGVRPNGSPYFSERGDHPTGRAVDIQILGSGRIANFDLAKSACSVIPFDQLLLEFTNYSQNGWVHIGYRGPGTFGPGSGTNRNQVITYNNHSPYKYGLFLLS